MAKKKYLCVGKIVGSRGLRGELKVEHYCDGPEVFFDIKRLFIDINSDPLDIENMRVHKSQILLMLSDVLDKDSAEKLKGKHIYAFREDIPIEPDSYFIEELKECEVYDHENNRFYGVLKDIFNTGANDIYKIHNSEENREYLVPAIKGTLVDVNLEDNKIFINPIEGIFDE